MVSKGTTSLIMLVIVLAIIGVFIVRFDGINRIKEALGFISRTFKTVTGGGAETTVIQTGETQISPVPTEGSPLLTQVATSVSKAVGQPSTFESQEIIASISGVGGVTLAQAQGILSPRGFEQLEAALAAVNLSQDPSLALEAEKFIQEQVSLAVGAEIFGEEFANPFGAFANPDFFIDVNTGQIIDEGGR